MGAALESFESTQRSGSSLGSGALGAMVSSLFLALWRRTRYCAEKDMTLEAAWESTGSEGSQGAGGSALKSESRELAAAVMACLG